MGAMMGATEEGGMSGRKRIDKNLMKRISSRDKPLMVISRQYCMLYANHLNPVSDNGSDAREGG